VDTGSVYRALVTQATMALRAIVACGVRLSSAAHASQSSYDGVQGAGNRDYCAVATQGVCRRNPCWPGWRPAGGHFQCVYACHRALESNGDRRLRAHCGTDASDFFI